MVKRYRVPLTPDDRKHLKQMISRGKTVARAITRARILLKTADATPTLSKHARMITR